MTPEQAAERVEHLRELRRFDDAERLAREALAAEPGDSGLLAELSATLLAVDRYEEGLAAAGAALAAAPDHEWAFRLYTTHLSWLGKHDEAVLRSEQTVARDPDSAEAHAHHAFVLNRAGQHARALPAARQAVELDPDDADHHVLVGDVAADLKKWRIARLAYHEALRVDPTHFGARHNLAALDSTMLRIGPALRGMVEAGSMDPREPLVAENLTRLMWRHVLLHVVTLLVGATVVLVFGGVSSPGPVVHILATLSVLDVIPLAWWVSRALRSVNRTAVLTIARSEPGYRLTLGAVGLGLLLQLGAAVTGLGWFSLGVMAVLGVLLVVFIRFVARQPTDEM
ncbi:tetratricopeptide repeat protein [Pseudonocardia sp. TRM90224]|uniref:tetratricopeptide repeat protein n=1 Tax=Pseudonocardia sp. TRM90224 TaxID=2812678 RepID=UPI001E3A2630|nr:tetratricopeptide repeat protein [Pseudonocardia sp. TRM90224]